RLCRPRVEGQLPRLQASQEEAACSPQSCSWRTRLCKTKTDSTKLRPRCASVCFAATTTTDLFGQCHYAHRPDWPCQILQRFARSCSIATRWQWLSICTHPDQ
ncbi:uncharacterized protein SEPMUDRAFT_87196, partial [Sphaerulina musiva SO2202]